MLIRPPGAQDEAEFLSRCLRCSECMKVCPTSGLQPTLLEAGLEGIWTPVLRSRLGYCDYACNACGQVCPSGAIPALELDASASRCWAGGHRPRPLPALGQDTPCIVCQEMCPVPDKAIELRAGGSSTPAASRSATPLRHAERPMHRLRHLRVPVPAEGRGGHPGSIVSEGAVGATRHLE